ncbi:MAG: NADH-quinone oxidoreductase subunit NuoE [Candidatus Aminicenantia bacterium]
MKEEKEITSQISRIIQKYPHKKGALIPILHVFQERFGFITSEMEKYVAEILGLPVSSVREVTDFYTMFKKSPRGKYHIMVCSSISCHLLGSKFIIDYIKEKLGISPGEKTKDGKFTLEEASCLGYCDISPTIMINEEVYGNLTIEKLDKIINELLEEK